MSEYLGPYLLGPNETPWQGIYAGDARVLARFIPDESVDLILCDPVYWEIEHYRWLGETAKRILKPFGYCIAQAGTHYAFEAMKALGENLDYYWLIEEQLDGPLQFFAKKVFQLHKPYLWFANGIKYNPDRQWLNDRVHSPRNKKFHQWGDGVGSFLPMVDRLTKQDAVIFDPFTGGGTVPAVCKILNRRCLAFEVKQETATKARERVRCTNPPLFQIDAPKQLELIA